MTDVTDKVHVKCKLCGYIRIVEECDEESIILAATVGSDYGTIQKDIECDKCNKPGGLVVIGKDGQELKFGDKKNES